MHQKIHGLIRRALATVATLSMLAAASIIGGCNTIEGVGRDVSAAGQTVADWAADSSGSTN